MTSNGTPSPNGNGRPQSADEQSATALLAALEVAGLSVDEALDAIELDPGHPRLSPLLARLGRHPAIVANLSALRADRATVASVAAPAPAGLLDGALEAARVQTEREALLSLERVDPAFDTPPVSRVVPARRRLADRIRSPFASSPVTVWLSLAATLLLVVSAAATLLADRLGILVDKPEQFATLPGPAQPDPAAGAAADPAAEAGLVASQQSAVATAAPAYAPLPDLDAARPALAARRLAVVLTGDPAAIDGLVRTQGRWTLAANAPAVTTAALPVAAFGFPTPAAASPLEIAIAADGPPANEGTSATPSPSPVSTPTATRVPVRIALARIPADGAALAAFVAQCERAGFTAELVELAEPVDAPADLSPDAVGWWGTSPTSWPVRTAVPVVVRPAD